MSWSVKHVGLSDRGQRRTANEDAWVAIPELGIFLVADGIGGTHGGGLAAQLVVETLPPLIDQRLVQLADPTVELVAEEVGRSIADLSRRLRAESQGESGLDGMGSTVVVAVLRPPLAVIAHLGDSRAYLLHEHRLTRCTSDHTLVQLLLDAGEIGENQMAEHSARGQLTRFVGMPTEAVPDVQIVQLAANDILLLCSDGLSGMVTDLEMEAILQDHAARPDLACRSLVATANRAGGHDNITALLIAVSHQPQRGNGQDVLADSIDAGRGPNSSPHQHKTLG